MAKFEGGLEALEPQAKIRLFILDASAFGGPTYHFHGHDFGITEADIADAAAQGKAPPFKSIYYLFDQSGKPIEFSYWPCAVERLGHDATGPSATPTLSVNNLDGVVTAMCLAFAGLAQAKVSIIDTQLQYLDPKTFGKTTPAQDPTANFTQLYLISRPSSIGPDIVTFELMTPVDFMDFKLPARQITTVCEWAMRGQYRGEGCAYSGPHMFDLKDNPVSDPALDQCAGLYVSCKKRFGEFEVLNFGGAPTAGLIR